ncbi:MAG: hypothetical protein ABSB09_09485 [Acidimicrobiales bacterium]
MRHSKVEIRDVMMEVGRNLLVDEGLGIGAGDLTFKRVFDRVEATHGVRLTNASVIRRVWENQAEFRDDVLAEVARAGDTAGDTGSTVEAALSLFPSLDLSTPEGRLRGMSQMARVGGEAGLRAMVTSRHWSLWVGVWILAVTSPPSQRGRQIRGALLDGYETTTGTWEDLHGSMVSGLGLRVREPFELRQFTVAVGALIEGCALRHGTARDGDAIVRPTGPDGALEEWTLVGVGLEALMLRFLEIDPDWVAPDPVA